jgi:O-antigen ligase
MGSTYRPYDSRLDTPANNLRWFIHNGHLRILLDSGIIGYLAFIVLSLVFLIRGFRNWKNIKDDRLRGIVLGLTLVYLVNLIAAVVNSTFTQWRWTPILGIIMGINEVIILRFNKEELED